MKKKIVDQLEKSIYIKQKILEDQIIVEQLEDIIQVVIESYKNHKKVLVAGNGGSAADAQHFVGELVSRFYFDRPALSAIALTTDTSVLTAIGNDYGYEELFKRQIEGLGQSGDVFFAISTSGNSKNVLAAVESANKKGLVTVGLTGEKGFKLKDLCNYCVMAPSSETPRIQEAHISIIHIICYLIEDTLFKKDV